MTFFDTYFPVLGSNFGTGALGIFQCFIGAQILSHHVDDFTLVAAFFLFSVSCLNMILGLIFRASGKHQRSIRAYRNQEPDPFADPKDGRPPFAAASPSYVKSMFTGSTAVAPEKEEKKMEFGEKAGFGFGRAAIIASSGFRSVYPSPSTVPALVQLRLLLPLLSL